ncbi:MAG: DUF3352 domain-containing protein [Nostocaceae cyanobacterium]|nr:DUF3352 domain-containing protein [Nostocaceae cyanobacterium]
MPLPVESVLMQKKKNKPSLVLTLSAAGLLIGGGVTTYWFLTQGKPWSRDLLVGANIIPQDALFAVSLSTNPSQWKQLRQFGTKETQAELDRNLVQWRDRFLTSNGYDFQKDIQPWVGDRLTFAILPPKAKKAASKPVASDTNATNNRQSLLMVLPIKNLEQAQNILTQQITRKQGKWIDRTYKGIAIKETKGTSGEKFSTALLDKRFVLITDNPQATERAITAYKGEASLATVGGFANNFPKVSQYQPFAQFYVNVPASAKIATASGNRRLPAQVLAQLQNNQGLAGTITLEPQGVRLQGVSWLKPNSKRQLAVENKAGNMQNRLPAETMMMVSGANLRRLWAEYVLTSQNNPQSPIPPEQLREGIKSLTNFDLDRDLISWMGGEFSLSVIPNSPEDDSPDNFRAALVFMVKTSDRQKAEKFLEKLDEVMKTQYQFRIQKGTVQGKPIVNWIAPFGTLTATHGWLDGDIAFLVLGAPVTNKIVLQPPNTLASSIPFQNTVPPQPNPTNGQLFLDVERTARYFPLPSLLPNQQTILAATRSIGVTSAVSDRRTAYYNIFVNLKQGEQPAPLPTPSLSLSK